MFSNILLSGFVGMQWVLIFPQWQDFAKMFYQRPRAIPFIRAFNSVVESCFSTELIVDKYEAVIEKFKEDYLALDITVMPNICYLLGIFA